MCPMFAGNDLALDLGWVVLLAWVSNGWCNACCSKSSELGDLNHYGEGESGEIEMLLPFAIF